MISSRCLTFSLLFALSLTACKQEAQNKTTTVTEQSPTEPIKKISLKKLDNSPSYSDAVLKLDTFTENDEQSEENTSFNFLVENYQLGEQTASGNAMRLANSAKGQHIHFILNNQPYAAHYESNFNKKIPNGVHHLVAFLSRSYHESVKNENSVVVKELRIGADAKDSIGLQMDAPTLIYSRPKGTYSGKDTREVLLDFFVLNTTLAAKGNAVKATINGETFMINEWSPYLIEGLPMGETTITLELLDASGTPIPGPFNTVERVITLTE